MDNQKIFITGATGFIGKTICKVLTENGYVVTVLTLPEDRTNIPYRKVTGDITDLSSFSASVKGHDAIIHLAGSVGYGQNMKNCERVNILGTQNIAKSAIESGIRRFIHFSTVAVYGRVSDVKITEDSPYKKIGDPYGDTKIEAEKLLLEYKKNHLDLTILRPTVIYGPDDDKFFPKLLENLKTGKAKVIGDGKNKADLIHVNDIAKAVLTVLQNPKSIGKIYNLSHPEQIDWNHLMELVAKYGGLKWNPAHMPYPIAYSVAFLLECISKISRKQPLLTRYAVRVIGKKYHYNADSIANDLNFAPDVSLESGIKEWFSINQQKGK